VRALAELIAHPVDVGTVLRRKGYTYDHRPDALADAARMLLDAAEHCRDGRWNRRAPLRLNVEFFHTGDLHEGQSLTILSLIVESVLAALDAVPRAHAAGLADLVDATSRWVSIGTSCYPSIPPSREAELAAQGYTAAELLLDMAAAHVLRIASYFDAVTGTQRAKFAEAAREARISAVPARKVIEQGVRYTLNGGPVKFERADMEGPANNAGAGV
jgi:hypothetical protein